jgi:hypothetical protein
MSNTNNRQLIILTRFEDPPKRRTRVRKTSPWMIPGASYSSEKAGTVWNRFGLDSATAKVYICPTRNIRGMRLTYFIIQSVFEKNRTFQNLYQEQ